MVLNRFLFWLLVRSCLLLVNLMTIAYTSVYVELIYTPIVLGGVAVFQVVDAWRFIRRTNDNLSRFLQSIQTRDFTIGFRQDEIDPSEKRLHKAFHLILDTIQESELARQSQYLYLKAVVEHIPAGIVAINEREHIDLINPEAQALLELPNIGNWRNLKSDSTALVEKLLQLGHGESRLFEVSIGGSKKYLSASLFRLKLVDKTIRLFTVKDIASEIDQKELEAWIKLTRVLTHEIMNSVTPLLSLTETMIMMLKNERGGTKKASELTDESVSDLAESLETVRQRSRGLLQFVDDYRKFTKIPAIDPGPVDLTEMLASLLQLMGAELKNAGIGTELTGEASLEVQADRSLLEQVFLNLITNAIHALEGRENPLIQLAIRANGRWAEVSVKDNGAGIDADKLEQIFIPFFSTKKEGSGIGLSLSRQIIYRHKGRIHAYSEKGKFTELVVKLPLK